MEVSGGQPHSQTVPSSAKEPVVPIEKEAGWPLQPACVHWEGGISSHMISSGCDWSVLPVLA